MQENPAFSRRNFLKIGALGMAALAVETSQVIRSVKIAEKIIDEVSPFDFTPLPSDWEQTIKVENKLPPELKGVAINAFGIWQADEKTWDRLLELMSETGARLIRISTLSQGFFNKNTPDQVKQINKFLGYIKEKVAQGMDIRIMCDLCDGYKLFQEGKFNGVYTAPDLTKSEIAHRKKAQWRFLTNEDTKNQFKNTVEYYIKNLDKEVISAWTIINEAAPVDLTEKNDPQAAKELKKIISLQAFNDWYLDTIQFIRKDSNEQKPICFGTEDPRFINDEMFKDFDNLIHTIHWYPGKPQLLKEVINDKKGKSRFPLIFQEGGFPQYIDPRAYLPAWWENAGFPFEWIYKKFNGKYIDLKIADDFQEAFFTEIVKEATDSGSLQMEHIGIWGGWINHFDGFVLDPIKQPKTKNLLLRLASVLNPYKDLANHPEKILAPPEPIPLSGEIYSYA